MGELVNIRFAFNVPANITKLSVSGKYGLLQLCKAFQFDVNQEICAQPNCPKSGTLLEFRDTFKVNPILAAVSANYTISVIVSDEDEMTNCSKFNMEVIKRNW